MEVDTDILYKDFIKVDKQKVKEINSNVDGHSGQTVDAPGETGKKIAIVGEETDGIPETDTEYLK